MAKRLHNELAKHKTTIYKNSLNFKLNCKIYQNRMYLGPYISDTHVHVYLGLYIWNYISEIVYLRLCIWNNFEFFIIMYLRLCIPDYVPEIILSFVYNAHVSELLLFW